MAIDFEMEPQETLDAEHAPVKKPKAYIAAQEQPNNSAPHKPDSLTNKFSGGDTEADADVNVHNSDEKKETTKTQLISSVFKKIFSYKLLNLALIVCVFLASIVWTNSILSNLQTSVQFEQELMHKQYDLLRQIQQSKNSINAYNQTDGEQLRQQAEALVFTDFLKIAEWLYRLSRESAQHNVSMEYQLYDAIADEKLNDIFIVPIEMTVVASNTNSVNQPYDNLLSFLHMLVSDMKYKQFMSAVIQKKDHENTQMIINIEVRKRPDDVVPAPFPSSSLSSQGMEIVE